MAILGGCHEGKSTPKLMEILCPQCGEELEVFVGLGTKNAGQITEEVKCDKCGHVIAEGTPVKNFEEA